MSSVEYDISPEGGKSDNACYQVPADIAVNKCTDNTTLASRALLQNQLQCPPMLGARRTYKTLSGNKH